MHSSTKEVCTGLSPVDRHLQACAPSPSRSRVALKSFPNPNIPITSKATFCRNMQATVKRGTCRATALSASQLCFLDSAESNYNNLFCINSTPARIEDSSTTRHGSTATTTLHSVLQAFWRMSSRSHPFLDEQESLFEQQLHCHVRAHLQSCVHV